MSDMISAKDRLPDIKVGEQIFVKCDFYKEPFLATRNQDVINGENPWYHGVNNATWFGPESIESWKPVIVLDDSEYLQKVGNHNG